MCLQNSACATPVDQRQAHRELCSDDLTVPSFLCKDDTVALNFFDTGIGEHIDLVSRESVFRIFGQGVIIGSEDVAATLNNMNRNLVTE